MGTPQFPELGRHCSVADCGINDFLPFSCDKCTQVFCLDHRGYASHHCPNAASGDTTVIVCPLCGSSIKLMASQDPNLVWNQHVQSSCNPAQYEVVMQKRKCPVKGCKELLKSSNTVRCKECSRDVCLKHRFGPDHSCAGRPSRPSPGMSAWTSSSLLGNLSSFAGMGNPTGPSVGNPGAARQPVSRGAAGSGRGQAGSSGQGRGRGQGARTGPGGSGQGRGTGPGQGLVVQGGRTAGQTRAPPSSGAGNDPANTLLGSAQRRMHNGEVMNGSEVCPQCSARFANAVSLVEHDKRVHEDKEKDFCRLS